MKYLLLALVLCGCYNNSAREQEQLDHYAIGCNMGYAASCVAMQEVYNQARTQAVIDDNDAIAEHAHWQNYWLAQQASWNAFNNNISNQIFQETHPR
jgi:hypothetical protein